MKKLICVSLVLVIGIAFASCEKQDSKTSINYDNIFDNYTYEQSYEHKESQHTSNKKTTESVDWREFLDEYEDWIDNYIKLAKKQAQNPTDFSILSEYATMMN